MKKKKSRKWRDGPYGEPIGNGCRCVERDHGGWKNQKDQPHGNSQSSRGRTWHNNPSNPSVIALQVSEPLRTLAPPSPSLFKTHHDPTTSNHYLNIWCTCFIFRI